MFVSDSYSVALSASLSVKLHSTLCTKLLTPVSTVPVSCQLLQLALFTCCTSYVQMWLTCQTFMCCVFTVTELSSVFITMTVCLPVAVSQHVCVCVCAVCEWALQHCTDSQAQQSTRRGTCLSPDSSQSVSSTTQPYSVTVTWRWWWC